MDDGVNYRKLAAEDDRWDLEVIDRAIMRQLLAMEEKVMEWIDVPAHRVLKLAEKDWRENFEILLPDGQRIDIPTLDSGKYFFSADEAIFLRKKDDKRFRSPRWCRQVEDFGRIVYLEEV